MIITDSLMEAIEDLRYLLSRGYNRESAVRFVGDKHRVTLGERYVLMRGIFDKAEAESRREKLVKMRDIKGQTVSIDGYNLLITVESMFANKPLIQCDDFVTRDISAVFGKHKITARTMRALRLILKNLKEHSPKEVHFSYDKQVSRSGLLASTTRRMIAEFELKGTAATAQEADVATLKAGGVTVSGDSVVIQKAKKVLDLAGELARQSSYKNVVQLPPQGAEQKAF
jgi:hypothetical protein